MARIANPKPERSLGALLYLGWECAVAGPEIRSCRGVHRVVSSGLLRGLYEHV